MLLLILGAFYVFAPVADIASDHSSGLALLRQSLIGVIVLPIALLTFAPYLLRKSDPTAIASQRK